MTGSSGTERPVPDVSRCGHSQDARDDVDDVALWARVQQGDEAAFEVLWDRYARRVQTYCYRRTASVDTAQDLVNVVFVRAWKAREDVVPEGGTILPFLLAVAEGCCRNARRALRRHADLVGRLHGHLEEVEPDFSDEAVDRLAQDVQVRAVNRALDGLRKEEREVARLCLMGGLGMEEAAAHLGLPVGTVKSRLSRARAKLRDVLGAESGEGRS